MIEKAWEVEGRGRCYGEVMGTEKDDNRRRLVGKESSLASVEVEKEWGEVKTKEER